MGEFISETLTDDSYFSIAPATIEKLLEMQNDQSFLVRAKALSVFRACMEQMEMYKDTTAYQKIVREYVEGHIPAWINSFERNLGLNVTAFDGEAFDVSVKSIHAIYKVHLNHRTTKSRLLPFLTGLSPLSCNSTRQN
jgi:hypothetical protein